MGQELTSRDRTLLIQEMARRQDTEITRLRNNVEALRSIFGRLQVFVREGWIDAMGNGSHWISAEAIMEILTAAETVIDDAPKSGDAPFGINRLGNPSVVDLRIADRRLIVTTPNPLDH